LAKTAKIDELPDENDLDLNLVPFDIKVTLDGDLIAARSGETILSLLFSKNKKAISQNDKGVVSGAYCGMGICFCCNVEVDGKAKVRACKTRLVDGMTIRTKVSLSSVFSEVKRP